MYSKKLTKEIKKANRLFWELWKQIDKLDQEFDFNIDKGDNLDFESARYLFTLKEKE